MVVRDEMVPSHNDAQENNILVSLANNQDMLLIDYEYCSWNTWTYDLANYINEFACDNAHPGYPYIGYYPDNFPSDSEMQFLVREYLKVRLETESPNQSDSSALEELWSVEKDKIMENLKKSIILNNFYWGVWAIMMLKEEEETEWDVFNWEFTRMRIDLLNIQRKRFGM